MSNEILDFLARHWLLSAAVVASLLMVIVAEMSEASLAAYATSPEELVLMMNRNQSVVVDIRDADAFSKSHIQGSINTKLEDFVADKKLFKKYQKKTIVLVYYVGKSAQSGVGKLAAAGYPDVKFLQDGITGWEKNKMPTVSSSN